MARYFVTEDGKVPVFDTGGNRHWKEKREAQRLMREKGWSADLTEGTRKKLGLPEWNKEQILDAPATAGAVSALSGLTLGASDMALRGALGDDAAQGLRDLREANPTATAIGSVAGTVGSALVPGAPLAWAGRAGRAAGSGLSRAIAGEGAGLARRGLAGGLGMVTAGGIEGAAIGAGGGLSDAAAADQMNVPQRVVSEAITGGMLGGGLGLAGGVLSSAGRFVGAKVKDVAKLHRLKVEQKALMSEAEALEAKLGTSGLYRATASPDAKRVMEIGKKLESISQKIEATGNQAMGKLGEMASKKIGQRMVMGALGGATGGPGGAALGMVLAPQAMKLVNKALEPVARSGMKVAAGLAGAGERIAATPGAGTAWKATKQFLKAQAITPMTRGEFQDMSAELDSTDPLRAEFQSFGNLPPEMPEATRDMLARDQATRVGFLKQKLDSISPMTATAFGGSARSDPGSVGRAKMARYARGALAPDAAFIDFLGGTLTPEVLEASKAVDPQSTALYQQAVEAKVRQELARGGEYSRKKKLQIAMFLEQPAGLFGFGSLAPRSMEEQQGSPQGPKPSVPKNMDTPHRGSLESALERAT